MILNKYMLSFIRLLRLASLEYIGKPLEDYMPYFFWIITSSEVVTFVEYSFCLNSFFCEFLKGTVPIPVALKMYVTLVGFGLVFIVYSL